MPKGRRRNRRNTEDQRQENNAIRAEMETVKRGDRERVNKINGAEIRYIRRLVVSEKP